MVRNDRSGIFIGVIVVTVVLQLIFIWGDGQETPQVAALEFSQAYFKLDPEKMEARLCSQWTEDQDYDVAREYVYRRAVEANDRGYELSFMKNALFNIHLKTVALEDNQAQVHLSAKRLTAINPVFAWVSKLFGLGEIHAVDETIPMVKEAGQWKVCGPVYDLQG